jgi:hypothetical protein
MVLINPLKFYIIKNKTTIFFYLCLFKLKKIKIYKNLDKTSFSVKINKDLKRLQI